MVAERAARPEPAPPSAAHQLVITFPADGRIDCHVEGAEVTPAEVYLAAWTLEAIAREVRAGQVMASSMRPILHDPRAILDELRRAGRA